MTKWKTSRWHPTKIERVECTRETDKCVWVLEDWFGKTRESRHAKESGSEVFHDTWEAAHAWLLERAENALHHARAQLAQAQGNHGNVVGLRKPTDSCPT